MSKMVIGFLVAVVSLIVVDFARADFCISGGYGGYYGSFYAGPPVYYSAPYYSPPVYCPPPVYYAPPVYVPRYYAVPRYYRPGGYYRSYHHH